MKAMVKLSSNLFAIPAEGGQRAKSLKLGLHQINEIILRRLSGIGNSSGFTEQPLPSWDEVASERCALASIHLALTRAEENAIRVLRILPDEAILLSTKGRVPYMCFVEGYTSTIHACDEKVFCEQLLSSEVFNDASPKPVVEEDSKPAEATVVEPMYYNAMTDPTKKLLFAIRRAVYGSKHLSKFSTMDARSYLFEPTKDVLDMRRDALHEVFGELWTEKQARILQDSPFKHLKNRRLLGFIVKSKDDLRQEQLAVQLIGQIARVFKEENLTLWVRPYTIICSSSDSGLVEILPSAKSVHSLKQKTNNQTLRQFYLRAFGPEQSKAFRDAQLRFIQSLAGYSLATYLLQIKDRHNGNIMLDSDGHMIHIDFGFMLSNSPGAIKFEAAPFKLVDEYLELMMWDATQTNYENNEGYLYFRELFVLGFLALRKHYERLLSLVEIMVEGTTMPCMMDATLVEQMRARFFLGQPESDCIRSVLALVDESCSNWRTRQYDRFQWYTNGIMV